MSEEDDAIIIRFVLPKGKNESTCSEDLSDAYDQARDIGINPKWIKDDQVLNLIPTKTDVFVMDPFEGPAFELVSGYKSTIVGPRCLLTCLSKGEPVPELPYPMYTAAMKGLIVTSTGFDKDKKNDIQKLIERMAGIYSNAFHDGVTHLVAAVVRSPKYEVAVKKEIPIMTQDWVHQVWNRSKNDNIDAVDKQFTRYACPSLMGLNICVSQMSGKDKDTLKKSIENHGGIYTKSLEMESTNVLITPKADGEKYNYAKKWKIPTIGPNWVFDSIEKGYCLPTESYRVEQTKVSTPTKDDVSKLAEVSLCSTIMAPPCDETMTKQINETVNPLNGTMLNKKDPNSGIVLDSLLESLDLSRVKRAGAFLDGYKIFLSGFNENQSEHLKRVILSAGALRMNSLGPSVTHVVVKTFAKNRQLKQLGINPFQVSLSWIVESMRLGRPAPESDFPPPSNNNASKLMGPPEVPAISEEEQTQFEDNDLMAQYCMKSAVEPEPEKPKSAVSNDETTTNSVANTDNNNEATTNEGFDDTSNATGTQVMKFLTGKKIVLLELDEDLEADLTECIVEAGGEIVLTDEETKVVIDYLIVPSCGLSDPRNRSKMKEMKVKKLVNNLWFEDGVDIGGMIPEIEYYHYPIMSIDINVKPMSSVVLGISGYARWERKYICEIAIALGMITQETFAKRDKGDSKRSTHLVCNSPEGSKYAAAIKWGLPVVDKDWIMTCARKMAWVSEKPFLLGDSTTITEDKPMPDELDDVKHDCSNFDEAVEEDHKQVDETEIVFKHTVENADEEDGEEQKSGVCTPQNTSIDRQRVRRLAMETPGDGLDIEKLRPKPFEMSPSVSDHWNGPPESQPSPSLKRKRQDDDKLPFQLAIMKTPETPYGAFLGNDNPSPKTRKFWKHQCDQLQKQAGNSKSLEDMKQRELQIEAARNARLAEKQSQGNVLNDWNEHIKEQFNPEQIKADREKAMDDLESKGYPVLGRAERSFDSLMEEKLNKIGKSWKNPAKRIKLVKRVGGIFDNVVVYITKKHSSIADGLTEIVEELGGRVLATYDSSRVTHVIFSGRSNDITKEFRTARNDGKLIVAPEWINTCRDQKRLIEEESFPHTFNPKMSLGVSVHKSPTKRRTTLRSTKAEDTTVLNQDIIGELDKLDEMEAEAFNVKRKTSSSSSDTAVEAAAAASPGRVSPVRRRSSRMTLTSAEGTPERSLVKANDNKGGGGENITRTLSYDSQNVSSSVTKAAAQVEKKEKSDNTKSKVATTPAMTSKSANGTTIETQIQWEDPSESSAKEELASKLEVPTPKKTLNSTSQVRKF